MMYTDRTKLWYYVSEELNDITTVTPILDKLAKHKQTIRCEYTYEDSRIFGLVEFANCICGETMHYRLGGYFTLLRMTKPHATYTTPKIEYTLFPTRFKRYYPTRYIKKYLQKKDLYNKVLKH